MPRVERHFEAMLVWMDRNPDGYIHTFFDQTHSTNNTKARIDTIKYKVDVKHAPEIENWAF